MLTLNSFLHFFLTYFSRIFKHGLSNAENNNRCTFSVNDNREGPGTPWSRGRRTISVDQHVTLATVAATMETRQVLPMPFTINVKSTTFKWNGNGSRVTFGAKLTRGNADHWLAKTFLGNVTARYLLCVCFSNLSSIHLSLPKFSRNLLLFGLLLFLCCFSTSLDKPIF